jgi:hypothetical protein
MTLKDLLKKKDKIAEGATPASRDGPMLSPDVPQFQFYRTTTSTQESIEPPSFPGDPTREGPLPSPEPRGKFGRFRRHSNATAQAGASTSTGADTAKSHGALAERLHFGRSRAASSAHVPENLPEVGGDGVARTEEDEARWEKRATVLVTEGVLNQTPSTPTTPRIELPNPYSPGEPASRPAMRNRTPSVTAPGDEQNIQEAIRLHEKGDLEASTALFGRLADPNSHNNALAQVLYGLALR